MWCQEACLIKKNVNTFNFQGPAQQKITVEGKAISKSLLFLPPLHHPQHTRTHTQTLSSLSHFSSFLSSFSFTLFFNLIIILLHSFCIHLILLSSVYQEDEPQNGCIQLSHNVNECFLASVHINTASPRRRPVSASC